MIAGFRVPSVNHYIIKPVLFKVPPKSVVSLQSKVQREQLQYCREGSGLDRIMMIYCQKSLIQFSAILIRCIYSIGKPAGSAYINVFLKASLFAEFFVTPFFLNMFLCDPEQAKLLHSLANSIIKSSRSCYFSSHSLIDYLSFFCRAVSSTPLTFITFSKKS